MHSTTIAFQVFREARRTAPCIVYLPHIGVWWQSVSETTRAAFLTLLQDLPSGIPILFLATAEEQLSQLPDPVQDLFSKINNEVRCFTYYFYLMKMLTYEEARSCF